MHLFEELCEDPDQALIVLGSEHLGDEPATLAEEGGGELEGVQGQQGLLVRVVNPIFSNVWGPVVKHKVGFCRF